MTLKQQFGYFLFMSGNHSYKETKNCKFCITYGVWVDKISSIGFDLMTSEVTWN